MYNRERHLHLNCAIENLCLLKEQVRKHPGQPIPDEWRVSYKYLKFILCFYAFIKLRLRDQQRASEKAIQATYWETVCNDGGVDPFKLIDKDQGPIDEAHLPYLLKKVRLNGRHLNYMLEKLQEMPSNLADEYEIEETSKLEVDLSKYPAEKPQ